jgi:TolB-like protein
MPRLLLSLLFLISISFADTKTVAISYFDNTSGLEEYNSLSKGLADMLITDLSNVESIQIVEREKLESLLNEIKLGEIKFFDPATAQKLGKGLGADIILTGAFLSIEPDMRIDARLIDVATGKIIKANKVLGKSSDFFMLESQLVDQLIANLDIKLTKKRTQIKQEIKLDAVVDYSRSIDHSDNGFE